MKSLFAILFFLSFQASAQIEFGVLGGMRSNQAETDLRSASVGSRSGFVFGAEVLVPVMDPWWARTGFMYVQRYSEIKNTAQGTVDIDFSYFDVPATAMYRFSDIAGVFAGPVLSFNQSKEVSCSSVNNCSATGVTAVVFPWQLGLNFKFLPQMGAEIYYEILPGPLADDISDMKSVAGNFVFFFE